MNKHTPTNGLSDLAHHQIPDASGEKEFNNIARLAAPVCNTSISLITITHDKQPFIKACFGSEIFDASIFDALHHQIVKNPNRVFSVSDVLKDDHFSQTPLATELPKIKFYSGTALINREGQILGSLWVLDQ